MPNVKNFAYSTVATAPSPATSGTSLVVSSGEGAKFPSVSFNATIWSAGVRPTSANAEVVTVTAISTDTLTITRAQESSSARTVIVGDQVAATITGALFPTGTMVGTTDAQTVSGKILSDTYMGKGFDTRITQQTATLGASQDYLVDDILENSGSYVLELPATSTLEVTPIVKQAETQSYFAFFDFIEGGCGWTADAAASTLLATMGDGYIWINGRRLRVNAVRSHTFTASKDTYVDLSDNGDGTAKVTYTEATNNAASPTLASGSLRNAIIISGASSIAAATSINQGQETMILPIASSIAYSVTDSLGNLICPRDPARRILGYRQRVADFTSTATSITDLTALNLFVNVPTGRKIRVSFDSTYTNSSQSPGQSYDVYIIDVTAGATVKQRLITTPTASYAENPCTSILLTPPVAGFRNYKIQFDQSAAGTFTAAGAANSPSYIQVELA